MDQPLLGEPAGRRGCFLVRVMTSLFPVLTWLPRYRLSWLKMDLLAGLTVGLTTVPQALAYAEVAGLPVQVRLSCSPLAHVFCLIHSLFLLKGAVCCLSQVHLSLKASAQAGSDSCLQPVSQA